jgi:hypothetical protein
LQAQRFDPNRAQLILDLRLRLPVRSISMTAEFQRCRPQLASRILTSCCLLRVRFAVYGRHRQHFLGPSDPRRWIPRRGRVQMRHLDRRSWRGIFQRELPSELAVVPLRTPFRILSRHRLPRLGLECLPHREVFPQPPSGCVALFYHSG